MGSRIGKHRVRFLLWAFFMAGCYGVDAQQFLGTRMEAMNAEAGQGLMGVERVAGSEDWSPFEAAVPNLIG